MKLTVENTKGKKVQIFDVQGKELNAVYSFDTKTCKLSFFLTTKVGDKIKVLSYLTPSGLHRSKKITTTLKGAYAVIDGKRVE